MKKRIYKIPIYIALLFVVACGNSKVTREPQLEDVKPLARKLFNEFAKKNPNQLEQGPCLGIIAKNWAIDIAHSPREKVDNLEENQCQDYITGKVDHLIEFDPRGQIITIK